MGLPKAIKGDFVVGQNSQFLAIVGNLFCSTRQLLGGPFYEAGSVKSKGVRSA